MVCAPPTISAGLGLVTQPLKRSDMTQIAEVTFALAVAGDPSEAVAQTTINHFQTNFNANMMAAVDSNVTAFQPSIRLGKGDAVPFEATATGATAVGGNNNTFPPPQIAVLIRKSTGLGGRKNRGRTYIFCGVDDTHVSENGTIEATYLGGWQTHADAFLAQLVTDTISMCIPNKTFDVPAPPHCVTAITDGPLVTSYVVEPLVATQRRRLGR